MINNVVLVGRIVRDIDLTMTPTGTPVVNNTLAVNRPQKQSNSDQNTDFINFVVFGKQAENLSLYMKKGSLIAITGRIQTRSYEKNTGQRVYITEVIAERVQFLSSGNKREDYSNGASATNNNFHGNSEFVTSAPTNSVPNFSRDENPFGATNPLDISDDDLPF